MTRRIPITAVTQSSTSPGSFTISALSPDNPSGDWTSVFKGKFYRELVSPFGTQAFYTSPTPPGGYELIEATQFDVIENASYAGRYTVYTPVSGVDDPSASFSASQTLVRVTAAIGAPLTPGDAAAGFVTNVSTYFIRRLGGEAALIIPPGTTSALSVNLAGRNFSGWGELFNQNFQSLLQHFSGAAAPVGPSTGQLWFDTSTAILKLWSGTAWITANSPLHSVKVAGSGATWVITHNLGALAPEFLVMCQFFVDVGAGVHKPIIPLDVTFDSANQLTVTFSSSQTGFALLRL